MRKIALMLVAILLSGCGAGASDQPAAAPSDSPSSAKASSSTPSDAPSPSAAVPSAMPSNVPSPSPDGLEAIQNLLTEQWETLQEKHAFQLQLVYSTEKAVMMTIRPYGDIEREPTEEEVEAFKADLFELAGEPFPLELSVWECCKNEPPVTGKIKSVEDGRVLIVNDNKKNGNSDDPEAFWVGLSADGKMIDRDGEAILSIDETLVGREAKAWTTGMVNQSYPGQTSALKIVIE